MKQEQRARQSNFELLRIISMLMIILWHIIMHGRVTLYTTGALKLVVEFCYALCTVHVNSFALLSGYFLCEKKRINTGKIVSILGQAWFYKAVIILIIVFFQLETISSVALFEELSPLDVRNYWFVNCYIVMLILSPFLNILICNIKQKVHRRCLLLCFLLFSVIPIFTLSRTVNNMGSTVIQFLFLYLLGSYLKKYPIRENLHFQNTSRKKRQLLFFSFYVLLAFSNFLLLHFGETLNQYGNELTSFFGYMISSSYLLYSNPLSVLGTVFYFLFFETLDIKSRWINWVASGTFGIYLIHDNYYVRHLLYKFLKIDQGIPVHGIGYFLLILRALILIFGCCLLIEKVRQVVTKQIKKMRCYQKAQTKVKSI